MRLRHGQPSIVTAEEAGTQVLARQNKKYRVPGRQPTAVAVLCGASAACHPNATYAGPAAEQPPCQHSSQDNTSTLGDKQQAGSPASSPAAATAHSYQPGLPSYADVDASYAAFLQHQQQPPASHLHAAAIPPAAWSLPQEEGQHTAPPHSAWVQDTAAGYNLPYLTGRSIHSVSSSGGGAASSGGTSSSGQLPPQLLPEQPSVKSATQLNY